MRTYLPVLGAILTAALLYVAVIVLLSVVGNQPFGLPL